MSFVGEYVYQTHRHRLLSCTHKLLIPADQHIRQIGDEEDDPSTCRGEVCSGKEHRDQETQHDGGNHENEQEQEDD